MVEWDIRSIITWCSRESATPVASSYFGSHKCRTAFKRFEHAWLLACHTRRRKASISGAWYSLGRPGLFSVPESAHGDFGRSFLFNTLIRYFRLNFKSYKFTEFRLMAIINRGFNRKTEF